MQMLVVRLVIALTTLAVSAHTRVTVARQPVPVLWLLALALVLAIAAAVLLIVRGILRDARPVREPANLHWLIVVAAAVPALAVAGFAGVQSYSHIEQLAIRAAEPMIDARMLPLSLDGIIVAGVVIILAGSWLGWLCVAPGVAGTLFANLAWGLPHGHLAATVATWPAVAFSVVSFVLERWLKSLLGRGGRSGRDDGGPVHESWEGPAIVGRCPHGVAVAVDEAIAPRQGGQAGRTAGRITQRATARDNPISRQRPGSLPTASARPLALSPK